MIQLITKKLNIIKGAQKVVFLSLVDEEDFLCRKSKDIERCYNINWFENGGFKPPCIFCNDGKIVFYNGRHRTSLLLEICGVDKIPMILLAADDFAGAWHNKNIKEIREENEKLYERMIIRPIEQNDNFSLPVLPFKNFNENE